MTQSESLDLSAFAADHIKNLHSLWREESPEFGYYPEYQDVNSKSITLINALKEFRGRRMLDIGCNSGLYSCLASSYAHSVVGCDVEPILVRRAERSKAYFQSLGYCNNVLFKTGSFTDILQSEFDGVLASLVLYHVGDEDLSILAEYLKRHRPLVVLQIRPRRLEAFEKHPEWKIAAATRKYGGMFATESNFEFLRDCGYESIYVRGLQSTSFDGEYFPLIIARE